MKPSEAIFILQGNIDARSRAFGPDDSSVKTAMELREVIEGLVAENEKLKGWVADGKRNYTYSLDQWHECAKKLAVELVNSHEQWECEMGAGTVERSLALAKFNQLEEGK